MKKNQIENDILNSNRIEEFSQDGRNFMSLDFSYIKTIEDLQKMMELAKSKIAAYSEQSLYTISNIGHIRFDLKAKELALEYLNHNTPYVKSAALIGLDGIKKIMINRVIKLSGRKNISFAYSKEQAIQLLIQQDYAEQDS